MLPGAGGWELEDGGGTRKSELRWIGQIEAETWHGIADVAGECAIFAGKRALVSDSIFKMISSPISHHEIGPKGSSGPLRSGGVSRDGAATN